MLEGSFKYGNETGAHQISDVETTDNMLRYCSLVCILHNKKLNLDVGAIGAFLCLKFIYY